MQIHLNFDLINVNDALNFANSTVGYKNLRCVISISNLSLMLRKVDDLQKFRSLRNNIFVRILIFLVFFKVKHSVPVARGN